MRSASPSRMIQFLFGVLFVVFLSVIATRRANAAPSLYTRAAALLPFVSPSPPSSSTAAVAPTLTSAERQAAGRAKGRQTQAMRANARSNAGTLGNFMKHELKMQDSHAIAFREQYLPKSRGHQVKDHEITGILNTYYNFVQIAKDLFVLSPDLWGDSEPSHTTFSEKARIAWVAAFCRTSKETVEKAVLSWETERKLKNWDQNVRGAASPSHLFRKMRDLAESFAGPIREYVDKKMKESDTPVTQKGTMAWLLETHGYQISRNMLRRVFGMVGVGHTKLRSRSRIALDLQHLWQRIFFIPQMAEAIKLENAGKAVIVNFDQSYAETNQASKYGYAPLDDPYSTSLASSRGRLLVVSGAVSRWGMVGKYIKGEIGVELPPKLDRTPPHFGITLRAAHLVKSALRIFSTSPNKKVSDYHGHFTHETLMRWFIDDFIPALKAQFPDGFTTNMAKKIQIIVQLDNASIHAARNASKPHLMTMGREAIYNLLVENNIPKITFLKLNKNGLVDQVIVDVTSSNITSRFTWFTTDELRKAVSAILAPIRPDLLYNDLEHLCHKEGIKLLWNPPSTPDWSPIETVWAQMKLFASWTYCKGRTPLQLMLNLIQGLYTTVTATPDANVHGGGFVMVPGPKEGESANRLPVCTPAAALFRHARMYMNDFIANLMKASDGREWLSGSLEDLSMHPELEVALAQATSREALLNHITQLVANRVGTDAVEATADGLLEPDPEPIIIIEDDA